VLPLKHPATGLVFLKRSILLITNISFAFAAMAFRLAVGTPDLTSTGTVLALLTISYK
jgi:hypothetical protein